jgi:hypothetical protein
VHQQQHLPTASHHGGIQGEVVRLLRTLAALLVV